MVAFHEFPDLDALAAFAAETVAGLLAQGLAERGQAALVVPGGRTPAKFLSLLGARPLAWSNVTVTLSDERWVDDQSPDSNEALLKRTLFVGPAAAARLLSLYTGAAAPTDAVPAVSERLARVAKPWDAVVLGMGDDGHFASLFPGEPSLAAGLDPASPVSCVPAIGPAGGPPRLSLTLSQLAAARRIFILATGAHKRTLWQAPGDLPAAALQHLAGPPVDFLWCP